MVLAVVSVIFFPIAAIFPFFIKMSVLFKMPSFSLVQTVAFLIIIFSCLGMFALPYPKNGYNTLPKFGVVFGFTLSAFGSPFLSKMAVQVNIFPIASLPVPFHVLSLIAPLKIVSLALVPRPSL